ncbi:MAG TPA: hypothetical protein PKW95_21630 [bacterium]|nr:hypothetical protein [bacterium]
MRQRILPTPTIGIAQRRDIDRVVIGRIVIACIIVTGIVIVVERIVIERIVVIDVAGVVIGGVVVVVSVVVVVGGVVIVAGAGKKTRSQRDKQKDEHQAKRAKCVMTAFGETNRRALFAEIHPPSLPVN